MRVILTPNQETVLRYIVENPGCSPKEVKRALSNSGRFAAAIQKLLDFGLIRQELETYGNFRNEMKLYPTSLGEEILREVGNG